MVEVKGWCPGALAPMESGDGLLMRAKTVGPRLSLAQAKEIAAISLSCGNGLIDLSQRAQLQMRGVSEATRLEAQARLRTIGLLAPSAEIEAVLNILASPLPGSGLDSDAMAEDLARAIASDAALHALPGKFLFLVDGGGAPGLADADADVRIEASGDGVAIALGGARDRAAVCRESEAVDVAMAMARAFLALREGRHSKPRRMRALIGEAGADAVFHAAGLASRPYRSTCRGASARDYLGAQDGFAGAAASYGRLRAKDFVRLIDAAERQGAKELRLSPWRALLFPLATRGAARRLATSAQDLGFIVDADDPRLAVVACPGAPECPQAEGATREGLELLSALARRLATNGVGLHVSGCAKGCAKPSRSPVTLVARPSGFDVVFEGRASDAPAHAALPLRDIASVIEERACPAH